MDKEININKHSTGFSFSFDMGTAKKIGLIPAIVANFISINYAWSNISVIGISGFLNFLTVEEIKEALKVLKDKTGYELGMEATDFIKFQR